MVAVGSGITVSAGLVDYPLFTAQSIRYSLAAFIVFGGARLAGWRVPLPRGRDWWWLLALAATGQALYNVAVVEAVGTAEPAAVAVFVGAVPLVLSLADSITSRTRPTPRMLGAASLVVVGGALVHGGGRTSLSGVGWSLTALACETAFTLLAVPLLGRIGPLGVTAHTCWIAAAQLAVLAAATDGTDAVVLPDPSQAVAIGYLALVVTSVAFVLWYAAVQRVGPATAGLVAGLVPLAGAVTGLPLGLTTISSALFCGAALVGIGVTLGLSGTGAGPAAQDPARRRSEPAGRGAHDSLEVGGP